MAESKEKKSKILPPEGDKLWKSIYYGCLDKGDDEETAAKKAWGTIKKLYKKVNGKWIKRKKPIKNSIDAYDIIKYIKKRRSSERSR